MKKRISTRFDVLSLWLRNAAALIGIGFAVLMFSAAAPVVPMESVSADTEGAKKPTIEINLGKVVGSIHPNAFGLAMSNLGNDAPELGYFLRTTEGKQKLLDLGFRTLNYGTDRNDWQAPYSAYTAVPESYPAAMLTNEFLGLANTIHAEPMISVNITHTCKQKNAAEPASPANVVCEHVTPALAVAWLKYIKNQGTAQVKYVQLGAEPYAGCRYWNVPEGVNCTVGAFGEHKIMLSQEVYADRAVEWAKALKKADPKIKVGLHLQPNTFVCQDSCGNVEWDRYVLTHAGPSVDFLITHQYYALDDLPSGDAAAQKFSYYQEQINVRVRKQGVTATPTQIRKELTKWLPSKKNMPIVIGEFNAGQIRDDDAPAEKLAARMSLFTGMSVTEAMLDLLSPVQLGSTTLPGAERTLLLDLNNLPVLIARYLPLHDPQTMVYSPAWHMISALKDVQGKDFVQPKINNNPSTPVGRGALRTYVVKKGKQVIIAVFNHSTGTVTTDLVLSGALPKKGTVTRIGDTATSFLTMNTDINPTAIAPNTSALPKALIKSNKVQGIQFAPHSLTVIRLKVK